MAITLSGVTLTSGMTFSVDSGTTDPFSSYVTLLLNGDGTNGSTTFTDLSSSPKPVTGIGSAQISTAQSKYGVSSMYFDGASSYLSTPLNSSAFYPSASGFTVEMWVRPSILGVTQRLGGFGQPPGGESTWTIGQAADNRFFIGGYDGVLPFKVAFSTTLATVGTWTHVAGVITGNYFYLYINGVLEGTSIAFGALRSPLPSPLSIGRMGDYDGQYFQGYIDDFRITNGVVRYAANFTPPVGPLTA